MRFRTVHRARPRSGQYYDVYNVGSEDSAKTLYFLGPYGGKKYYFYRFIVKMTHKGYRVVFLQPSKQILRSDKPSWLGEAITQARAYVAEDRKNVPRDFDCIVGVSLGSYLGLNVLLEQHFSKFVVVAGGAPLMKIFKSNYLFRSERKKLTGKGYEELEEHWVRFDTAFKDHQLSGLSVLGINSKVDEVIPRPVLEKFMTQMLDAGAAIENNIKGYAPHVVQSLSLNFRVRQVEDFLHK